MVLERNRNRSIQIPEPIIFRMNEQMNQEEDPQLDRDSLKWYLSTEHSIK
jgi:hypothetical protein